MAISTLFRTAHSFKSTLGSFMSTTTVRATLLIAGLLAVPLVAFTSSASAVTYPDCSTGLICMYEHANYAGASYVVVATPGQYNLPASWNDRISSVANYSNYKVEFKANAGCTGLWTVTVKAGHVYSDFSGSGLNDESSCYIVS